VIREVEVGEEREVDVVTFVDLSGIFLSRLEHRLRGPVSACWSSILSFLSTVF